MAGYEENVPIPGEPYTFNVLVNAQALGDLQALHASKRRATRVQLDSADSIAIQKLAEQLG